MTSAQRWMAWALTLSAVIVGTWVAIVVGVRSQQCDLVILAMTVDGLVVLATLAAAAWVLLCALERVLLREGRESEVRARVKDGHYADPHPYRRDEPRGDQGRW